MAILFGLNRLLNALGVVVVLRLAGSSSAALGARPVLAATLSPERGALVSC